MRRMVARFGWSPAARLCAGRTARATSGRSAFLTGGHYSEAWLGEMVVVGEDVGQAGLSLEKHRAASGEADHHPVLEHTSRKAYHNHHGSAWRSRSMTYEPFAPEAYAGVVGCGQTCFRFVEFEIAQVFAHHHP